jgi:hypothetical protein
MILAARTLFVLLVYLVAPFGLLTWRANAAAYDSRSLRAVHNGGTASGVLSLSACGPCFFRDFFFPSRCSRCTPGAIMSGTAMEASPGLPPAAPSAFNQNADVEPMCSAICAEVTSRVLHCCAIGAVLLLRGRFLFAASYTASVLSRGICAWLPPSFYADGRI